MELATACEGLRTALVLSIVLIVGVVLKVTERGSRGRDSGGDVGGMRGVVSEIRVDDMASMATAIAMAMAVGCYQVARVVAIDHVLCDERCSRGGAVSLVLRWWSYIQYLEMGIS